MLALSAWPVGPARRVCASSSAMSRSFAVVHLAGPGPYKLMAPRLLTSTESWNHSMLAAPQSAARRAKWASVIPTSMHAKSKPKFTKAYSFGLVTGSSRYCHEAHNSSLNDQ